MDTIPLGLENADASHHPPAMPQSLSAVYIHLVFSTKDRRPFLRDKPTRDALHSYLGGVSKQLDCPPIQIGGVEDHIHLLARFGRTITQAEWVKELKRVSNLWLKERGRRLRRLRVAGRLRGFLREPVESRTGEAIHHRTGGASLQDWFSGRVARVVETTRGRMGREICLGLNPPCAHDELLLHMQKSFAPGYSGSNPESFRDSCRLAPRFAGWQMQDFRFHTRHAGCPR
jgi:REP element-mobilizing transposase RayT